MYLNQANDVNEAVAGAMQILTTGETDVAESRNGPVRRSVFPVTTVTTNPMNRVLFSPLRNANPFFHYMESLWMLAGRNDLPWLAHFNKRMASYSDDGGKTQPAAYGHRWQNHFGHDQIVQIVEQLRRDHTSRRAVLAMWDGFTDPHLADKGSADIPCNTHVYFRVIKGKLDMTVCCRSNDVWWGAHGANAVHFSILHEYVAAALDRPIGTMFQISNDYHLYTDIVNGDLVTIAQDCTMHNLYMGRAVPTALFYNSDEVNKFNIMLPQFMDFADPDSNPLLPISDGSGPVRANARDFNTTGVFAIDGVAYPMLRAWDAQKHGNFDLALTWAGTIGKDEDCDWRIAAHHWIARKRDRKAAMEKAL